MYAYMAYDSSSDCTKRWARLYITRTLRPVRIRGFAADESASCSIIPAETGDLHSTSVRAAHNLNFTLISFWNKADRGTSFHKPMQSNFPAKAILRVNKKQIPRHRLQHG